MRCDCSLNVSQYLSTDRDIVFFLVKLKRVVDLRILLTGRMSDTKREGWKYLMSYNAKLSHYRAHASADRFW